MDPGELIIYMLCGFLLLLILSVTWFVLRKRKKWALAVTALLVIGYVGYYFYLPTLKATIHAAKYEQITEYLDEKYPGRQFTVMPEHYEDGIHVGRFDVNDKDTPEMGVTLFVENNGDVIQTSYWHAADYPPQQDLWQTITVGHHDDYSLDSPKVEITKEDELIEGELTVFALNINGRPAIAIMNTRRRGTACWICRIRQWMNMWLQKRKGGPSFISVNYTKENRWKSKQRMEGVLNWRRQTIKGNSLSPNNLIFRNFTPT